MSITQQEHDLVIEAALKDLDRFALAYGNDLSDAARIMERMIDSLMDLGNTPGQAATTLLGWIEDHPVFQDRMRRILKDLEKAS
jgi:hypothetical protein